jgi:hypothetical protein
MAVIGIHQAFKVRRHRDGKTQDQRDQNNQGEKAAISRLGLSSQV